MEKVIFIMIFLLLLTSCSRRNITVIEQETMYSYLNQKVENIDTVKISKYFMSEQMEVDDSGQEQFIDWMKSYSIEGEYNEWQEDIDSGGSHPIIQIDVDGEIYYLTYNSSQKGELSVSFGKNTNPDLNSQLYISDESREKLITLTNNY